MPSPSRAVLICGPGRPLAAAVMRTAAAAGMSVGLQAGQAEASAAARLCAALGKRGGAARAIEAELGGDRDARALIAAAAKGLRRLDAVVICTAAAATGSGAAADLAAWPAALSRYVRTPFFLAKHAAAQLRRRRGGRIVIVWSAPSGDDEGLGPVLHESLLCLVDALPRAVGSAVAVAAVIGRPARGNAAIAEAGRAVRFLLEVDPAPRGTVLHC